MDLDHAIDAHLHWRMLFKTAMSGGKTLDVAKIERDDKCVLGKWLQGEGKVQHRGLPQFQALVATHKRFHDVAGKVATAINAGREADAVAMLAGPFHTQSAKTVAAIKACKEAIPYHVELKLVEDL